MTPLDDTIAEAQRWLMQGGDARLSLSVRLIGGLAVLYHADWLCSRPRLARGYKDLDLASRNAKQTEVVRNSPGELISAAAVEHELEPVAGVTARPAFLIEHAGRAVGRLPRFALHAGRARASPICTMQDDAASAPVFAPLLASKHRASSRPKARLGFRNCVADSKLRFETRCHIPT